MRSTILVIPAEGDSPATEQWYIQKLKQHYGQGTKVLVFDYGQDPDAEGSIQRKIIECAKDYNFQNLEIHAQGGLGAYTACQMYYHWDFGKAHKRIKRIFFIGGAPSSAMTWPAKLFHRYFAYLWYILPIPFFADDPNPHHDPIIDRIRRSSTQVMQSNPKLYRNQLALIGKWGKDSIAIKFDRREFQEWIQVFEHKHSHVHDSCKFYFVPNGETVRPKWWDNTYSPQKAIKVWAKNGVQTISQPSNNFSFYSMMPAESLFKVMDEVRHF